MKLESFDSLADATDAFNALKREHETLKSESAELIEAADSEINRLSSKVEQTEAEVEEYREIAAAQELEITELKAKLDSEWKKAAHIAAQSDTEPVEDLESNADTRSHLEIYSSLKGAEQTRYYKQHEKAILAGE